MTKMICFVKIKYIFYFDVMMLGECITYRLISHGCIASTIKDASRVLCASFIMYIITVFETLLLSRVYGKA